MTIHVRIPVGRRIGIVTVRTTGKTHCYAQSRWIHCKECIAICECSAFPDNIERTCSFTHTQNSSICTVHDGELNFRVVRTIDEHEVNTCSRRIEAVLHGLSFRTSGSIQVLVGISPSENAVFIDFNLVTVPAVTICIGHFDIDTSAECICIVGVSVAVSICYTKCGVCFIECYTWVQHCIRIVTVVNTSEETVTVSISSANSSIHIVTVRSAVCYRKKTVTVHVVCHDGRHCVHVITVISSQCTVAVTVFSSCEKFGCTSVVTVSNTVCIGTSSKTVSINVSIVECSVHVVTVCHVVNVCFRSFTSHYRYIGITFAVTVSVSVESRTSRSIQ